VFINANNHTSTNTETLTPQQTLPSPLTQPSIPILQHQTQFVFNLFNSEHLQNHRNPTSAPTWELVLTRRVPVLPATIVPAVEWMKSSKLPLGINKVTLSTSLHKEAKKEKYVPVDPSPCFLQFRIAILQLLNNQHLKTQNP
jgi:hypothetical protein